ncbi:hypothetical protein VN97_g6575 [Penicillium thymicola]|uniref:Uncharacterized protein n=1 Tax=Penicillium thymicola TaxID=293382 RepID=A0AAI9TGT8_PENTH|nr:hypothetical protein VN97_g6575 [Penicillium thymicola]
MDILSQPSSQGGEYGTALQASVFVYRGNMSIVQTLLNQGANVNAQGGEYGTTLQAAAVKGHQEIVQLLLDQGADVNSQGGRFRTAFQAAVLDGSMTMARLLLDRYGDKILIAEEALKKVLETSNNAVQLMSLLLQKQEHKITITEEILMTAVQSERGHQLVSLFLESSVKISDDVIWVRELGKVGYSTHEIMELLLEDSNDSPWIFFEPTCFPRSEIKPGRHIPGCCHHFSPLQALPTQIVDPVFESHPIDFDHQGIIFQVQELCGLAGIKPTTRRVTDWVGYIEFNDSDQVLSVSYALPTDESKPPNNAIFWSRISRALDGLYHAAALMQTNNLCCNSFTVLRSGFQGHEQPSSSLVEIINVSFKPVLILIQDLQKVMSPDSESSDNEKLLSTSTTILGLIWPEITKAPDDSSIERCLQLCSLAAQFLCLGFLSYCQAHIGSVQPFFLDFFAQQVRLMGIQKGESYPFLITELVNLTCLGNMTRGPVLLFRSSSSPPHNQSSKTQTQRLMQKHDISGHVEDLLDTWGPGNLILRGDRSGTPIAIKIGDGFIFTDKGRKLHWSQQMPDIKGLSSIDTKKPLLIGSLVAVNAACKPIEAESRIISANLLEELGTSRSSWQKSQRQLAIQGAQYVICQAAETWNKQTGIPVKDRALAYPPEVLVRYLDSYWGVQVSYCTGVAKRVRLRKLVADLVQHFSAGSVFNPVLEAKMKDETLRPKDLQVWLNGLSPDLREESLNAICDILNTLRHTGLDSTEKYFYLAWPFEGNTTQCFKIPLEHDSSRARFLADSHDAATFAYIAMECFETPRFRCSKIPGPCFRICLLETTVSRGRKEKLQHESLLQHEEICFFSKQDTLFWVKVLKKHADQPASLVDLVHIQSIPYNIRQRLYLSERRKQRSRLRECATMWTQGEAVSVSSIRRSRKSH